MGRLKILVADDDKSIQELYQLGLGAEVFEVRFAGNGREALDTYQSWKPDLLLLDIVMPVMTGYSVLQEIRETLRDRNTKIIMATSLSSRNDIKDCTKFCIQGYIVKPFNFREVGSRILHYYEASLECHE